MKKKFYRSCVAMLLTMVMIFGGVHIGAGAVKPGLPPIYSSVEVEITNTHNVIDMNDTLQMTYYASISGGTARWSSSNTSVATVNANGLVTAITTGAVKITLEYTYTGLSDTAEMYLYIKSGEPGIKNGAEYYIMNIAEAFISLGAASDNSQTVVNVNSDSSIFSRWRVEIQSNETYQLINTYSPTGKCLTTLNDSLCIDTDTATASQKFNIERIESEVGCGLYFIKQNGKYLTQDYEGNLYFSSEVTLYSYWSFMAVEKRYGEMFCFKYTYTDEEGDEAEYDSTAQAEYFVDTMDDLGYFGWKYENYNSVSGYACLKDDDVFVYRGHGGNGRIAFCSTGNVTVGRIVAHSNMGFSNPSPYYINHLPHNALSLSRCIIYLGCSTGKDYEIPNSTVTYNLLDETFNKGAHFVLGTTETIYTSDADDWLEYFLDYINIGCNIYEAIDNANERLGKVYVPIDKKNGESGEKRLDEMPITYRGDGYQHLNFD